MNSYVSSGYVIDGYIFRGIVPLGDGAHDMKFFVSSGNSTEQQLKDSVVATLSIGDIAVIYIQELNKISVGNALGFAEFLSGTDINTIVNDTVFIDNVTTIAGNSLSIDEIVNNQIFIDKVKELSAVSLTASIVDSTGSVVVGATVTQIDATTFSITVPPELIGQTYNIVLNKSL